MTIDLWRDLRLTGCTVLYENNKAIHHKGYRKLTSWTADFTSTEPLLDKLTSLYTYSLRIGLAVWTKCLVCRRARGATLKEIRWSMCSLPSTAYISFALADFRNVCWEIKQILRGAEVTTLSWNWPEVCCNPLLLLGWRRSDSDLHITLINHQEGRASG